MTLTDLLDDHPAADEAPIAHTAGESITAAELRSAAGDVAGSLQAVGVEPGTAVAVVAPNTLDALAAMFGVWKAGGVYVPISPRTPDPERAHFVESVRPAVVREADGTVHQSGVDPATYPDSAFVMWTSGTTGTPKPILHGHEQYLELIDRVLRPLRAKAPTGKAPSPNLIPVPLTTNAGLYNVLFGLRAGAPLVLMDGFDPYEFAELVHRFEIRSTVLPPGALTMITDTERIDDLSPLRYIRCITAPLSPTAARRFVDRFPDVSVLNGYGQAEIGEVIGWTAADSKQHPDKVGAVGRPHPGVEIRIVTGDGVPVDVDVVGELWVKPPQKMKSYADGTTPSLGTDGFWRTGDLARVDPEGFVWIEGRQSDVINRGGNKVFPAQVEEVIRLDPDVAEAVLVGIPDERLGELPVAFIVGTDADPTRLDQLCRSHLVAYKVPARFEIVDELPRTEVGKIRRAELVARHKDTHP
jgi:long-chain acyl-CoA synthetase